jgi:hypothetical protein
MTLIQLLMFILSPAFAQDDGPEGDDPKDDEGNPNGKDSDKQGDSEKNGNDFHDGLHFHDSVNDGSYSKETSSEKTRDSDIKSTYDHPFGDYSRAIFDAAKDFVDNLAKESPEARDLKAQFDEAESARSLYESWNRATTEPSYTIGDQPDTISPVHLLDQYQKVELVGLFLGLTPTSTTGGAHAPGSSHYSKGAVDFRVWDLTLARQEQAIFALRSAGIFVRDERGWPERQNEWSAPHIHAQAAPTDPSKNGPLDRWSNPQWRPGTFMNRSNASHDSDAKLPTQAPVGIRRLP